MTKDEALKLARSRGFVSSANDWLGLFEDLGMLKLDEPKRGMADLLERASCWEENKYCLAESRKNLEVATALIKDMADALRCVEK